MVLGTNEIGETSGYVYNGLGHLVGQVMTVKKNAYGYTNVSNAPDLHSLEDFMAGYGASIEAEITKATDAGNNTARQNDSTNSRGSGISLAPSTFPTEEQPLIIVIDPDAAPDQGQVIYKLPPELIAFDGQLNGNLNQTSVIVKSFVLDYASPLAWVILESESGAGSLSYRYTYGLQKLSVSVSPIANGAGSIAQNGKVKLWYHQDRLGSVDYLTDNVQGNAASYVTYDDWGALTMKAILKLGVRELDLVTEYTGHPYDQVLGVYYARARMYDAADRRWLSMDLIGTNLANPGSYNRYAYVWGNPVCLVDPYGLEPKINLIPGATVTVFYDAGSAGKKEGTITDVYKINDVYYYVKFEDAFAAYGMTGNISFTSSDRGKIQWTYIYSPQSYRQVKVTFRFTQGTEHSGNAEVGIFDWDGYKYSYTGNGQPSPFYYSNGVFYVKPSFFHQLMCSVNRSYFKAGWKPKIDVPPIGGNDYKALAEQYGKESYVNLDYLLSHAHQEEIIARVIYGEKTKSEGQLGVAWTMVNRVLAQRNDMYADPGKSTTLFNIATKTIRHVAYSALTKEGGNDQSYTSKNSSDDGWLYAVTLSVKMCAVLNKYYPNDPYPHNDRVRIRGEVSATIGNSPIGGAAYYRTTTQFNDYHSKKDGKDLYMGDEIFGITSIGGNTFFSYTTEGFLDVGL